MGSAQSYIPVATLVVAGAAAYGYAQLKKPTPVPQGPSTASSSASSSSKKQKQKKKRAQSADALLDAGSNQEHGLTSPSVATSVAQLPAKKAGSGKGTQAQDGLTALQAKMKSSLDGARFRYDQLTNQS